MRFILLLFFSTSILACDKPLTVNYGPFVSLLVVEHFFGEFHKSLASKSKCKVDFQLNKDFDQFVQSLFEKTHTLAVVPSAYHETMVRLGYVHFSSEYNEKARQFHVIAKRKSGINKLEDLSGRKVLIMSSLSASGSYFIEELDKLGLLPKVELHYNFAYENMVLAVLKNEVDAAVIIQGYWNLISPSIRENQIKIIKSISTKSDAHFYILKEYSSLIPIANESLKSSAIEWGNPTIYESDSALLKGLLKERLEQFLEDKKTN